MGLRNCEGVISLPFGKLKKGHVVLFVVAHLLTLLYSTRDWATGIRKSNFQLTTSTPTGTKKGVERLK